MSTTRDRQVRPDGYGRRVLFVGGPWAGRIVDYGNNAPPLMIIHEWLKFASSWGVLDGPQRTPVDPPEIKMHRYRVERVFLGGPGCVLDVVAWVHESITDQSQIARFVLGYALASALFESPSKEPPRA